MTVNQEEKWEKLKISEFLNTSSIIVDLKATTKKAALEELVAVLAGEGKIQDAPGTVAVLLDREKLGSTGIGQGIAIPHAKTEHASDVVGALGISRRGLQFEALDGEPVYIIFLLVAPPSAAGPHLKALARISRLLKDKFFRQSLREMRDPAEIIKRVREEDQY